MLPRGGVAKKEKKKWQIKSTPWFVSVTNSRCTGIEPRFYSLFPRLSLISAVKWSRRENICISGCRDKRFQPPFDRSTSKLGEERKKRGAR